MLLYCRRNTPETQPRESNKEAKSDNLWFCNWKICSQKVVEGCKQY